MSVRDIEDAVAGREVGHYPLSIATSLAFEGMTGKHPDIETPRSFKLNDYSLLFVNIETLIRNLHGSLDKETRAIVDDKSFADALVEEVGLLFDVVKEIAPHLKTQIYHTPYSQLSKEFPNAIMKPPSKNQHLLKDLNDKVLMNVNGRLPIEVYDRVVTQGESCMIITHKPLDLLKGRRFKRLTLVESHTGRQKDEKQWWSKLYRCNLDTMPFNGYTLQIYGDGLYFSPQSIKYKRKIEEIALRDRWSYTTTISRIRMAISGIPDKGMREELTKLFEFK